MPDRTELDPRPRLGCDDSSSLRLKPLNPFEIERQTPCSSDTQEIGEGNAEEWTLGAHRPLPRARVLGNVPGYAVHNKSSYRCMFIKDSLCTRRPRCEVT